MGFHPQVRWPTRCKRCFRDYKEHNDDNDRARYGNLAASGGGGSGGAGQTDNDPWSGRRAGFQKSKSLDVSLESNSRFG